MILTISICCLVAGAIYAIARGTHMALYLKKHGITQKQLREQRVSAKEMYKQLKNK